MDKAMERNSHLTSIFVDPENRKYFGSEYYNPSRFGVKQLICSNEEEILSKATVNHSGIEVEEGYVDKLGEFVAYQPTQAYMDLEALSKTCIVVDSDEGKNMLVEAMGEPYMEPYLMISSQCENQYENTCGQTALVVALNSLKIDPGWATWYGKWRWHSLRSLAACNCDESENLNITKDQFSLLAICNDANALPVTATESMTSDEFRNWIKYCMSRRDTVMVVNFDRLTLNQDGVGHFTTVAGFHEERDMVLVADVSKHKYPPYWVPSELLLRAMKSADNVTGQNRGFVVLSRPDFDPSKRIFGLSHLFRVDVQPGSMDSRLVSFVNKWKKCLDDELSGDTEGIVVVEKAVESLVAAIPSDLPSLCLMTLTLPAFRLERQERHSIVARCKQPHHHTTCSNQALMRSLQSIYCFQAVRNLTIRSPSDHRRIMGLVSVPFVNIDEALQWNKSSFQKAMDYEDRRAPNSIKQKYKHFFSSNGHGITTRNGTNSLDCNPCPGYIELLPEHVLMICILSWPYSLNLSQSISQYDDDIDNVDDNSDRSFDYLKKEDISLDENSRPSNGKTTYQKESKIMFTLLGEGSDSKLNHKGMARLYEEIKSLKRKFGVVLNYHHLL